MIIINFFDVHYNCRPILSFRKASLRASQVFLLIDVQTLPVHKTCHIILNKTQFPFHNPKIPENSLQFKLNCCHFASILISSPAVITHKLTATSFLFFYGLKALFNSVRPWQVRGGRLVGHTMQSQTEHFFFFFFEATFQWMDDISNLINWDSAARQKYFERKFDLMMLFEDVRDII